MLHSSFAKLISILQKKQSCIANFSSEKDFKVIKTRFILLNFNSISKLIYFLFLHLYCTSFQYRVCVHACKHVCVCIDEI